MASNKCFSGSSCKADNKIPLATLHFREQYDSAFSNRATVGFTPSHARNLLWEMQFCSIYVSACLQFEMRSANTKQCALVTLSTVIKTIETRHALEEPRPRRMQSPSFSVSSVVS